MDIADTILAKSDQLNAVDLPKPVTVTVAGVDVVGGDQPVHMHLAEFQGKPYKPSKGMRRALIALWGPRSADYAGRYLTLFNEPTVLWAGKAAGGIRISHASHIAAPITITLAIAKSKREPHTIAPLIPPLASADQARAYWTERKAAGASPAELAAIAATVTPTAQENNA